MCAGAEAGRGAGVLGNAPRAKDGQKRLVRVVKGLLGPQSASPRPGEREEKGPSPSRSEALRVVTVSAWICTKESLE